MKSFLVAFLVAVAASSTLAETCQKPEVQASAYVTEDATVLTQVAFTTQFTLKCANGAKGISLYAEVDGKSLPAVRLSADNKYQVCSVAFNQLILISFSLSDLLNKNCIKKSTNY